MVYYLIVNQQDNKSDKKDIKSKIKKAADIGVNIINEEQLSELIKNG